MPKAWDAGRPRGVGGGVARAGVCRSQSIRRETIFTIWKRRKELIRLCDQLTSVTRVHCATDGGRRGEVCCRRVVFLAWMLRPSVIPAGKQTNKDEALQSAIASDLSDSGGSPPSSPHTHRRLITPCLPDRRLLLLAAILAHTLPCRHATRHLHAWVCVPSSLQLKINNSTKKAKNYRNSI